MCKTGLDEVSRFWVNCQVEGLKPNDGQDYSDRNRNEFFLGITLKLIVGWNCAELVVIY
jgi:hypothetical protein